MTPNSKDIDRALAGRVTDTLLGQLKISASRALDGQLTHYEGEVLLLCMPAIIQELIDRRAISADACDITPLPDNVIQLSPRGVQ